MEPTRWAAEADKALTGLETEWSADRKKFYREDEGNERAKRFLTDLEELKLRLHKLIR